MIIKKDEIFSIKKDGSSYYRVYRKRTRIGSFLFLSDAESYVEFRKEKETI